MPGSPQGQVHLGPSLSEKELEAIPVVLKFPQSWPWFAMILSKWACTGKGDGGDSNLLGGAATFKAGTICHRAKRPAHRQPGSLAAMRHPNSSGLINGGFQFRAFLVSLSSNSRGRLNWRAGSLTLAPTVASYYCTTGDQEKPVWPVGPKFSKWRTARLHIQKTCYDLVWGRIKRPSWHKALDSYSLFLACDISFGLWSSCSAISFHMW